MTPSPLPSNAEVAAVLREVFGEQIQLQGTPELMAEVVLRIIRIARGET